MKKKTDRPALKSDLVRLDKRLGISIRRLDKKVNDSVARLDKKIDDAVARLDKKIDDAVARLDKKIDDAVERLDKRLDAFGKELGEVREDMRRVVVDQAKLHGLIHDSERRMIERMDLNTSKILDAMTGFVAQVQTIDRRQVVTAHRVDALESRISAVERFQSGA